MEVKVNNIRTQVSVNELENNYNKVISRIWDICDHNDYRVRIDGVELDEIFTIKPNFSKLTQNARKNVAKRFHFFDAKKSLKTMNVLFLVLNKLGVITEKVTFNISDKEKNINRLRITYKAMKDRTEKSRLEYKKEKGNFYK